MSVTRESGSVPESGARAVARVAASQHGVFSRAQAVAAGMKRATIDRRVSKGVWERLYAGVYRVGGAPASWHQSLLAACLAWGAGAVVSHRAAAALWLFLGFETQPIELSVPRSRRRAHQYTVHRPRSLPRGDVTTVNGIPVTSAARTLLDIASVTSAKVFEEALDDALRRKLVSLKQLRWKLRTLGSTGRPGAALVAACLDAREGLSSVPQSVFETRVLRLLGRAGLPVPALQHRIMSRGKLVAIVDFAYPDQRIAIEAEGHAWHSSKPRWERDHVRRNALTSIGWAVVGVTWTEMRARPESIVRVIVALLKSRGGFDLTAHETPDRYRRAERRG